MGRHRFGASLALTSDGTGKIQQFTDQSTQGLISASAQALLQFAQQALAAFDTPPTELDVILYQPGILPGQLWTWALGFLSALLTGESLRDRSKGRNGASVPLDGGRKFPARDTTATQSVSLTLRSPRATWTCGGLRWWCPAGGDPLVRFRPRSPRRERGNSTSGNYGPELRNDGMVRLRRGREAGT